MDCIGIEGMEFFSAIGYYKQEKSIKGKFIVDVYIYSDLSQAGDSDELSHTINYEEVYEICKKICHKEHDLIESVAYQIIKSIKNAYSNIEKCKICVSKINPPLSGIVKRTFVELEK